MRRKGFTLLEMLWALLLFGIAATIGVQVVSRCIAGIVAERQLVMRELARHSFIKQLRDDVWNCRSLDMTNGSLVLSDGVSEVRYAVEGNRVMRFSRDGQTNWDLHDRAQFACDRAAVLVSLGDSEAIAMASPKVLAGGAR